jgi:Uma2 family endonuclease
MSTDSDAQKKYMTMEEYLQLEEYSEVKHEYNGGSIVEMPGAQYRHNVITSNTNALLWQALASHDTECTLLSSDMKIHIPAHNSILYPDLSIMCGEPLFYQGRKDVLTNPKVIIEVLSKSTQAYDRGKKFEKYSSVNSVEEYVLIGQDQPLVEVFLAVKKEEDIWKISRYHKFEEEIKLHSVGIRFPLKDIYKHIEFS